MKTAVVLQELHHGIDGVVIGASTRTPNRLRVRKGKDLVLDKEAEAVLRVQDRNVCPGIYQERYGSSPVELWKVDGR